MDETVVSLTREECEAIHDLINMLSGDNARHTFNWEGDDDPADPMTSGPAKIFMGCGRDVPDQCRNIKLKG